MNRKQTFCIFIGVIIFVLVGVSLEAERLNNSFDRSCAAGDTLVILFMIICVTVGFVFIFKELTRPRDIILIVSFAVIGLIVGGLLYLWLNKFSPKYTAESAVEVMPPGVEDPMSFDRSPVNMELYYQFRISKAAFMKQEDILQQLLRRDKIRETKWFKQFNNDMADAVENLQDNLVVKTPPNNNLITVSMTCGSADESDMIVNENESALIVNQMVDLFLDEQKGLATRDVRSQLAERTKQQQLIKAQLLQAEDTLNIMRGGTEFVNLDDLGSGSYLESKLAEIESAYIDLLGEIAMLESHIEMLRRSSVGNFNAAVREQISCDPVMISLAQHLALKQLELASGLVAAKQDPQANVAGEKLIAMINEQLDRRKTEIAEQIRQSDLKDAENRLTAFTKELESLEQQRIQAKQEYKDLDNLRASYQKIATIRDQKQQLLEDITNNIEKLNMIFNDPEISKVKPVGLAPEPLQPSSPQLGGLLIGCSILGLLTAIGIALLIPKPKKMI
jgi:capsular polysaccharide biosynthesis protein